MVISSHLYRPALLTLASLLFLPPAEADDFTQQRASYQQALKALSAGKQERFEALKQSLADYPLYPYFVFENLRRRLASAPEVEIEKFLADYEDTPLAEQLLGKWLPQLARTNRWRKFIDVYDGRKDIELACYHERALIRAGQTAGVEERATTLWLTAKSQPAACDRLFDWLKQRGALTRELVWKRIVLAMKEGETRLVTFLAKDADAPIREWTALWAQVHKQPRIAFTHKALRKDTNLTRLIVSHGIRRIAENDVDAAEARWLEVKPRYAFPAGQRDEVEQELALLAAYRHHPDALERLNALSPEVVDQGVRIWRVRSALRRQDWGRVPGLVDALDPEDREKNEWRYWLARAFAENGKRDVARRIYEDLAQQRDYHGFLAADRLDLPYSMQHKPLVPNPELAARLVQRPGVLRARELFFVDQLSDATREWNRAIKELDQQQLRQATILAHRWGWHPTAIRTASTAGTFDALEIRFPTPYRDEVLHAARKQKLEATWLYGIMRRESAFRRDARSSAGARGLMQLMPATARQTAKKLGLKHSGSKLSDETYNITLGSAYLRQMLDRFGNPVLAAAAYNAGPNRVRDWLPKDAPLPTDIWVDTISIYETREYVRATLAYTVVFDWKFKNGEKLKDRMPPTIFAGAKVVSN